MIMTKQKNISFEVSDIHFFSGPKTTGIGVKTVDSLEPLNGKE